MKRLSFQKKIFISYSLLIVLFILIAIFIFSFYVHKNLTQSSINSLDELSYRTSKEVESLFYDMDQLALYISTNPLIRDNFKNAIFKNYTTPQMENKIVATITSFLTSNKLSKFRINLFNKNRIFVSTGLPFNRSSMKEWCNSQEYTQWYNSLPIMHAQRSISNTYPDYLEKSGALLFSVYREITDPNNIHRVTGIVEIQCPISYLQDILSTNTRDSYYILNADGKLLYSSGPLKTSQLPPWITMFEEQKTLTQSGAYGGYIYSSHYSEYSNMTLIITRPYSEIVSFIRPIIITIIIISSVILCVTLGLVFFISKKNSEPLAVLTQAVNQVTMSNLSLEVPINDSDNEFVRLNAAFHKMFQRLEDSMEEVVQMKSHEMRAHMIALQAQMDPHFLYNMLTIIQSMSLDLPDNHIGKICDYLSNMLRYNSTYKEDYTTLEKEFSHAEDYLNLMKIRYEDMFNYSFEIDPSISHLQINLPKLSIQPIVENSFQHGFKQVLPPWEIKIKCWVNEYYWFLSVTDNGIGISEKEIQQINEKVDLFITDPATNLPNLKLGGMGLVNTIVRFKLKYKEDIIFKISPAPSQGTCITIGGRCDNEYTVS